MAKPRQVFMWLFFGDWVIADALLWWKHETLWAITWAVILAFVGLMEAVAKITTGRTLSQRYVQLHQEQPVFAWVISILTLLGMVLLQLHLML